jgi:hypothetical protein
MRRDNSHHLVAAAQRRRADTLERAQPYTNLAKPASGTPSPRSPPTPASPAHGSMPSPNYANNSAG